jgi:hypothetical protein
MSEGRWPSALSGEILGNEQCAGAKKRACVLLSLSGRKITPITATQAIQVYWQLCDANYSVVKPHQAIALFLSDLTQFYPSMDDLFRGADR